MTPAAEDKEGFVLVFFECWYRECLVMTWRDTNASAKHISHYFIITLLKVS